jgi:hypothetical protein
MPAKRPLEDAIAIYIIVEVYCRVRGMTRLAAWFEISGSLRPYDFEERRNTPCVDAKERIIVGDKLSADRVEALYKQARKLLAQDTQLHDRVIALRVYIQHQFKMFPGSVLLPLRNRGAHAGGWIIAHVCPDAGPHADAPYHCIFYGESPRSLTVKSCDLPDGRFE